VGSSVPAALDGEFGVPCDVWGRDLTQAPFAEGFDNLVINWSARTFHLFARTEDTMFGWYYSDLIMDVVHFEMDRSGATATWEPGETRHEAEAGRLADGLRAGALTSSIEFAPDGGWMCSDRLPG